MGLPSGTNRGQRTVVRLVIRLCHSITTGLQTDHPSGTNRGQRTVVRLVIRLCHSINTGLQTDHPSGTNRGQRTVVRLVIRLCQSINTGFQTDDPSVCPNYRSLPKFFQNGSSIYCINRATMRFWSLLLTSSNHSKS